jgi:hypothetical protein
MLSFTNQYILPPNLSQNYIIAKAGSCHTLNVFCRFACGGGSAVNHLILIGLSFAEFLALRHSLKRISAGPSATLITYLIRWYFALIFHQYLFFNLNIKRGILDRSKEISQIFWQAKELTLAILIKIERGST